ncbi:hypothetical protein Hypma_003063 [Hypsizygus marmoreus]|uniref:Nephrocystin 3-like N-terminal domain-containing protein n=1 Tax=Hypsizygus marmoreus TaxID=39966 RepID=A0A369J2R6_HYPMA|nr:hypothetical protein Hypma_003063 [Hypsizygus marmoreus]
MGAARHPGRTATTGSLQPSEKRFLNLSRKSTVLLIPATAAVAGLIQMAFANAHDTHIYDSSFTDVQGLAKLFKEISPGASYDSQERSPPPRCHPDTRKNILEEIRSWIDAFSVSNEGSLMWLHGPAGAGKSAIAQTVSESCSARGELAASFFFSHGALRRDTSGVLFVTIAFQLAMTIPGLRQSMNKVVEDDPSILHKATSIQLRRLILEPFLGLSSTNSSPLKSPFVVVIDGIDECTGNTDQTQFIFDIGTLVDTHHLPLCFLLVSRPEPHLRSCFENPSMHRITRHLSLYGTLQAEEDIFTYLQSGFSDIRDSARHTDVMVSDVHRKWPGVRVIQLLAERSGGYFIYASTLLKFIDEEYFSPIDRLDEVLNTSLSGSIAFAELDKLYQKILSTSKNTSLLVRILGYLFLCNSQDRLHTDLPTTGEIEAVLGLRSGDVQLNLRGLHSLLHIYESPPFAAGSYIVPFHNSFRDFLFDSSRAGNFFIHSKRCRVDIVCGTLKFLKHRPTWESQLIHPKVRRRVLRNWPHHLPHISDTNDILQDFRSVNTESWAPLILASKDWSLDDRCELIDMLDDVIEAMQVQSQGLSPLEDVTKGSTAIQDFTYHTHLSPESSPRSPHDVRFIQGIMTLLEFGRSLTSLHCTEEFVHIVQLRTVPPHLPIPGQSFRLAFSPPLNYWVQFYDYIERVLMQLPGPHVSDDNFESGDEPIPSKAVRFMEFMNDPARSKDRYLDSAARHANLTCRCIDLVDLRVKDILTAKSHEHAYARRYWAMHLSLSSPGDQAVLLHLQYADARYFLNHVYFSPMPWEVVKESFQLGREKERTFKSDRQNLPLACV